MKQKLWMSWSTGKDSALALYEILQSQEFEVEGLFTTVNESFGRVAMHSTREELLAQQAFELDLPLTIVKIPYPCTNEIYEQRMAECIQAARAQNITHMAFGDLYLEEIRDYRLKMLTGTGITPVFPLWGISTTDLAARLISLGFKAIVTCVDTKKLPQSFVGRSYDASFLTDLPPNIDPCAENGEFHTVVYSSPNFRNPLKVKVGEIVRREGFCFADVVNGANNLGQDCQQTMR